MFYSDSGLHNGGRGLFMGENLADRVLFLLGLFWMGDIGEEDVVKGGITLSFDEEIGVIV